MNSALALAAVTAVLKHLLANGLVNRGATAHIGGEIPITSLPPDRIPTGSGEERTQLNLFLFHVAPLVSLRHLRQEKEAPQRSANAVLPLMLELSYLLTIYGGEELQAELILGQSLQLLHETPILSTDLIRRALASISAAGEEGLASTVTQALVYSTLAEQAAELPIKLVPQFVEMEEMCRMWSAFQARYRPSAIYKVSAVRMECDGA